MRSKSYQAPWGKRVWLITAIVVIVGIVVAGVLPFVLHDEKESFFVSFIPAIALAAVYGGTALFVVRGYELTNETVIVRRSFWRNTIDLKGLTSAIADPTACKGAFKTIGNDGLFAMHGYFRSKKLGKFRAFVTNTENSVILQFDDRTIVISPENPRSFVNELNRRHRHWKENS